MALTLAQTFAQGYRELLQLVCGVFPVQNLDQV